MKKLTLSIVALSFVCGTYAQERLPLSFSSQSVYFNPAMTGPATNNFQSLLYGYEDSGEDQKFTTNALLNYDHFFKKINSTVGINLSYNDQPPNLFGLSSNNYEIGLLYNYRIQIRDSLSVRVGIRASYMSSDSRFIDPGDIRLFIYTENSIPIDQKNDQFNLDAGFSIYWKRFFFGTAVKRITEPVMKDQFANEAYLTYPMLYFMNAGGVFAVSKNIKLESAVLYGISRSLGRNKDYRNYYSINLNSIIHNRFVLGYNGSAKQSDYLHGILSGYKFNKFTRVFVLTKTRDMNSFGMEIGANVGF